MSELLCMHVHNYVHAKVDGFCGAFCQVSFQSNLSISSMVGLRTLPQHPADAHDESVTCMITW